MGGSCSRGSEVASPSSAQSTGFGGAAVAQVPFRPSVLQPAGVTSRRASVHSNNGQLTGVMPSGMSSSRRTSVQAQAIAAAAARAGNDDDEAIISGPLGSIKSSPQTLSQRSLNTLGSKKKLVLQTGHEDSFQGTSPNASSGPNSGRRQSSRVNSPAATTTTISSTAPTATSSPSTPVLAKKAPTISSSSKSTASPSTLPAINTPNNASNSNNPPARGKTAPSPAERNKSLAEETAELQQLLKDMKNKTDTWISNLESKQSDEAVAADAAAMQAHRDQVAANRAAATAEKQAQVDRRINAMANEKFEEYQSKVETDKLVMNLRVEMDRKTKRMKEEEEKRTARRDSKKAEGTDANTKTALDAPITPSHKQSSNTTLPLISPSNAQNTTTSPSAVSIAAVQVSTSRPNLHTPSQSFSANRHPLDSSTDFENSDANLNSPGAGKSFANFPTIAENGGDASPRGGSGAPSTPTDEATRKIIAERNAMKRSGGPGSLSISTSSSSLHKSSASMSALSNSGLPSAPTVRIAVSPRAQSMDAGSSSKTDLESMQEELLTSADALARAKVLEQKAAETPDGAAKQKLLNQSKLAAQLAEVRRLEEVNARRREELAREKQEMKQFIVLAKDKVASAQQNQRVKGESTTKISTQRDSSTSRGTTDTTTTGGSTPTPIPPSNAENASPALTVGEVVS